MLLLLAGPALPPPVEPGPVSLTVAVTGPTRVVPPGPILQPDTIRVGISVGGPNLNPTSWVMPVVPRTIRLLVRVNGPQIPALPPEPPHVPGTFPGPESAQAWVTGVSDVLEATCSPSWNEVGEGSVTSTAAPSPDAVVTFYLGGTAVFQGYAADVETVLVDSNEEAGEQATTRVVGLLDDWERTTVLPDFGGGYIGSGGPSRLGAPIADVRHFDFTMNGTTEDGFSFGSSSSRDPVLAALDDSDANRLDLPDGFSDDAASWMWAGTPGQAPAGWVIFRAPTLSASEDAQYVLEGACYDYCEVWVDGTLQLTLDQAGQVKRVPLPLGNGFHLVTPRAHNGGGRAGLILSIRPVVGDRLGSAILRSGSGWTTIAYQKSPLIRSIGAVLHRLHREAKGRGAPAGNWTLAFTEDADSAGRQWPIPTEPYTANIGQTYLGFLRAAAETDLDFVASPTERVLYCYIKDQGTGSGATVPWTAGVDLDSYGTKAVSR